jgi:hypothetical protein
MRIRSEKQYFEILRLGSNLIKAYSQLNAGKVGHDYLLPNPYQFINYVHSPRWMCTHTTLLKNKIIGVGDLLN